MAEKLEDGKRRRKEEEGEGKEEEEVWLLHLSGLGMASQRGGMVYANQKHVQRLGYHPYRLRNEGFKALVCLLKAGLVCTGKQGMVGTKPVLMPHVFIKKREGGSHGWFWSSTFGLWKVLRP